MGGKWTTFSSGGKWNADSIEDVDENDAEFEDNDDGDEDRVGNADTVEEDEDGIENVDSIGIIGIETEFRCTRGNWGIGLFKLFKFKLE